MTIKPFSWTCTYCNQPTTIVDENYQSFVNDLFHTSASGRLYVQGVDIVCPNTKCRQRTFKISTYKSLPDTKKGYGYVIGPRIKTWNLLPSSKAKPYPEYVPKPIRNDYEEACSIVELSPKSSATLSRRALQGLIRDFWKIKAEKDQPPLRLSDEIKQIRGLVDPMLWQAIEGVRKVGNIGAHMDEDINIVVDVEPKEAEALIGLIELLISETYIARQNRQEGVLAVAMIAKVKGKAVKAAKATQKEVITDPA